MKNTAVRMISAALVLMLASATACGKTDTTTPASESTTLPTQASETSDSVSQETGETKETTDDGWGGLPLGEMTPGCLYILNREAVVSSVAFTGNVAGSSAFNPTKTAVDKVRNIFELNEWIDVYLITYATEGLKVYVFKHNEVGEVYAKYNYSGELPNLVATADLTKPENSSDSWGSFYINPENAAPGYYDIVFVHNGVSTAVMKVRLYAEGKLAGKTDNELYSIMDSIQYE